MLWVEPTKLTTDDSSGPVSVFLYFKRGHRNGDKSCAIESPAGKVEGESGWANQE